MGKHSFCDINELFDQSYLFFTVTLGRNLDRNDELLLALLEVDDAAESDVDDTKTDCRRWHPLPPPPLCIKERLLMA